MIGHTDFAALFAGCEEAFRLEGLPEYSYRRERLPLARYRHTGQIVAPSGDWPLIVQTAIDTGTTIRRLRLVSVPLTLYERWELGLFTRHPTGEQVRVLPRPRLPYRQDVWVFDRTRALRLIYDPRGAFQHAEALPADPECQYWIRRYQAAPDLTAEYVDELTRDRSAPVVPAADRTG